MVIGCTLPFYTNATVLELSVTAEDKSRRGVMLARTTYERYCTSGNMFVFVCHLVEILFIIVQTYTID